MKQLQHRLKGHSHHSWMLGAVSLLVFVLLVFRGDSVRERIHSHSWTSPQSVHHSYQFRRWHKRRCVFCVLVWTEPARHGPYWSATALPAINSQTCLNIIGSNLQKPCCRRWFWDSSPVWATFGPYGSVVASDKHIKQLFLMTLSLQRNAIKMIQPAIFSWRETAAKTLTQREAAWGQSGAPSFCKLWPPVYSSH